MKTFMNFLRKIQSAVLSLFALSSLQSSPTSMLLLLPTTSTSSLRGDARSSRYALLCLPSRRPPVCARSRRLHHSARSELRYCCWRRPRSCPSLSPRCRPRRRRWCCCCQLASCSVSAVPSITGTIRPHTHAPRSVPTTLLLRLWCHTHPLCTDHPLPPSRVPHARALCRPFSSSISDIPPTRAAPAILLLRLCWRRTATSDQEMRPSLRPSLLGPATWTPARLGRTVPLAASCASGAV